MFDLSDHCLLHHLIVYKRRRYGGGWNGLGKGTGVGGTAEPLSWASLHGGCPKSADADGPDPADVTRHGPL
jgi:hypothetical protein